MKQLGTADPRQIGPYVLMGRLGAGGMGAVYLGRSAGGRTVAVKIVRPELAEDDAFRDRFRHEVEAARRVSGAFTAAVVDADTQAEVPWMATTFVPGVALEQAVRSRGPLPEGTLWTMTAGVAEALLSVHEAGLVHRDLKPANVLLALDGPHVIDFGIARAVDGTALTSTGAVIGSAPYMSPEQAVGSPLTSASDVFSLASTIAFAARGENLYGDGAAAAVLFRIVHTEPDLSAIPSGLRELLAACLAQDPAARPSPRQVCELIEREGRPISSGGWLPEEVVGDVVALRSVMTALPTPPPTEMVPQPTVVLGRGAAPTLGVPHPGARPPRPSRPTRRTVLLSAAGSTLGVAGLGTWFALNRENSGGLAEAGETSAKPRIRRPAADDLREATLAWKVKQPEPIPQVICTHGVVLGMSLRRVVALDDDGKRKWTVDAADFDTAFALEGSIPKSIAAVEGERLYVGGMSMNPTKSLEGESIQLRGAVTAIDLAKGKGLWTTALDREHTMGVLGLAGVRNGKAYVVGMGDGKDHGRTPSGFHVWRLDVGSRKTDWFHGDSTDILRWGLPTKGGGSHFASNGELRAMDAKGKVRWSKELASHTLASVGSHVVIGTSDNRLTAFDDGGKRVWSVRRIMPGSPRRDGIAVNEKESLLYVLELDSDGGRTLRALESGSGKTRWKAPLPAEKKDGNNVGTRVLHSDGNLYRMDGEAVIWAFNSTDGTPRWRYTGFKGTDPLKLAWHAGDGRLAVSDPTATTIAVLHANGA